MIFNFFNSKPNQKLININGYLIDENSGILIDVPKGLSVYTVPKEVKKLSGNDLSLMNPVISAFSKASEIIFEDGGVEEIPNNYFTCVKNNIKKITLPEGLRRLGDNSIDVTEVQFNYPSTLKSLGKDMYPETKHLIIGENIEELSKMFASHDVNLESIFVSGSIKDLPAMFLNQCKNLKVLVLSEGVVTAGKDAFRGLNSLCFISLPESFVSPLKISYDSRSGVSKRGNSTFDGKKSQELFNGFLTVQKRYKGRDYNFQVRKSELLEMRFENGMLIARPINTQLGAITLSLVDLTDDIYRIDFQNNKVISLPKNKFTENEKIEQRNSLLNQDVILERFQSIYKSYIIPSSYFKSLDVSRQRKAKTLLFEFFEKSVSRHGSLDINDELLFFEYVKIVQELRLEVIREEIAQLEKSKLECITNMENIESSKKF